MRNETINAQTQIHAHMHSHTKDEQEPDVHEEVKCRQQERVSEKASEAFSRDPRAQDILSDGDDKLIPLSFMPIGLGKNLL